MSEIICLQCGKQFKRTHDMARDRKYCSRECYEQARREGKCKRGRTVIVTCDQCGSSFTKYASAILPHNFCSRKCFDTWYGKNAPAPSIETRLARSTAMRKIRPWHKRCRPKLLGKEMHRTLMELKLGRRLKHDEVVHHINHDPFDNRIENLQLMTRSEHVSHHNKKRTLGGDATCPHLAAEQPC